jgi:26S proteasome regulatory subunit N6
MKAVAKAYENRSLKDFEAAKNKYKQQLKDDAVLNHHLESLYDHLLEQNLMRIIEPYSRVQIAHVAKHINLPAAEVENKLSQMILDKNLIGVLDQSNGTLVVYEKNEVDQTFETALETIDEMEQLVESLYEKARKL